MPNFINVNGHIEVYDQNSNFMFSADNEQEAIKELMAQMVVRG